MLFLVPEASAGNLTSQYDGGEDTESPERHATLRIGFEHGIPHQAVDDTEGNEEAANSTGYDGDRWSGIPILVDLEHHHPTHQHEHRSDLQYACEKNERSECSTKSRSGCVFIHALANLIQVGASSCVFCLSAGITRTPTIEMWRSCKNENPAVVEVVAKCEHANAKTRITRR